MNYSPTVSLPQGASEVKVTLLDQSSYDAKVVGVDPDKDVAVLQLDMSPDQMASLQPVSVGASGNLMVGQKVSRLVVTDASGVRKRRKEYCLCTQPGHPGHPAACNQLVHVCAGTRNFPAAGYSWCAEGCTMWMGLTCVCDVLVTMLPLLLLRVL